MGFFKKGKNEDVEVPKLSATDSLKVNSSIHPTHSIEDLQKSTSSTEQPKIVPKPEKKNSFFKSFRERKKENSNGEIKKNSTGRGIWKKKLPLSSESNENNFESSD